MTHDFRGTVWLQAHLKRHLMAALMVLALDHITSTEASIIHSCPIKIIPLLPSQSSCPDFISYFPFALCGWFRNGKMKSKKVRSWCCQIVLHRFQCSLWAFCHWWHWEKNGLYVLIVIQGSVEECTVSLISSLQRTVMGNWLPGTSCVPYCVLLLLKMKMTYEFYWSEHIMATCRKEQVSFSTTERKIDCKG